MNSANSSHSMLCYCGLTW